MPASMRIGVSALDRSKQSTSVAEELMVDKLTGQMLIRSKDGNVVSYDAVSRLSTHVRQIEDRVTDSGYMGSIGVLELTSEYPLVLGSGNEITLIDLASKVTLFADKPKQFLVSADLDVIKLSSTYSDLVATGDTVRIGVRYKNDTGLDKLVVKTLPSSKLNAVFFSPDLEVNSSSVDMSTVSVTLEELTVVKSTSYVDTAVYQYVLNSVVVFTEK